MRGGATSFYSGGGHSNTDLERQTTNHVAAKSRKLSRFSLAL